MQDFAGPYKTVARLFRGVLYITGLPGRAILGIMALPDVYWVLLFIAGVAGQVKGCLFRVVVRYLIKVIVRKIDICKVIFKSNVKVLYTFYT